MIAHAVRLVAQCDAVGRNLMLRKTTDTFVELSEMCLQTCVHRTEGKLRKAVYGTRPAAPSWVMNQERASQLWAFRGSFLAVLLLQPLWGAVHCDVIFVAGPP